MIDKALIGKVLAAAMATGGDFAELFIEDKNSRRINLTKGIVESALSGRDYGVGLRIFSGLNSVYTFMSGDSESLLMELAHSAAATIAGVPKHIAVDLTVKGFDNRHEIKVMPGSVALSKKIELMKLGSAAAFAASDKISQVVVNFADYEQNVIIANTDGLYIEDRRVRTRYMVNSVASEGNKMEDGYDSFGRAMGFEMFDIINVEDIGRESARIATTMLAAGNAPSGKFPVVMENKFGGVIFHEACGHGLEAAAVAKGPSASVYAEKLGQQIASPLVSAVDDGTIPNGWGSLNIDDEGVPATRNILIENGVLKGYMVDKLNGLRMNMSPTGSSRRESYKFAPTSRMTNTYILNGSSKHVELFGGIEYGLYAKSLGGGSVNTATGEFNFAVQEGYIIRDGKVCEPVKGASLVGTGLEVIQKIDMVADTFASGEGMCGASSGSIPAGLGQPALRVSSLTVGGREE